MKKGLEVCGQCPEFPCSKFKSEEEYQKLPLSSSYPPYRNVLPNLRFIKGKGIKRFIDLQGKRISLLETMIERYEGRSKSFFCRAAALLELAALRGSLYKAKASIEAGGNATIDTNSRAKVLTTILAEAALCDGIALKTKK